MSNHTIGTPITTWAAARTTDREVLNRAEVATLLSLDPSTIDHAIADGTIPAVHVGRRVLIPRRPFLHAFGADGPTATVLPCAEEPACGSAPANTQTTIGPGSRHRVDHVL